MTKQLTITDINNLIYDICFTTAHLSKKILNNLHFGYGCADNEQETITKLTCYKWVLEQTKLRLYNGGTNCLDDNQLQCIIEAVSGLTIKAPCGVNECRTDLKVDDSNLDDWLVQFPQCCTYSEWERFSKRYCKGLGITFGGLEIEKECDFVFEVTKEIIPQCILTSLSIVYEATCDPNLTVNRNEQECKIDWKILLEQTPKCDLDFNTYLELVDCKLTYDIIKQTYDNQCRLEVKNESAYLISPTNKSYNISDISFSRILGEDEIEINKLRQDYK